MSTHGTRWKFTLLASLALLSASALLTGCVTEESGSDPAPETSASAEETQQTETAEVDEEPATDAAVTYDWTTIELTDVETGETFAIADFAGQQVLVQAFAVW